MADSRVIIFDTTLRDGEQSPGCSMNLAEKLRMARQLDRLGVDVIEAGFPIASDGDFEAVQAIAKEIRGPVIAALARTTRDDILRAGNAISEAARPRIHIFLATSDIHLQHKLRITREEALRQAREAVGLARSLCDDVEFSPEDATRTDLDFLCAVVEAVIDAGASTVNIPDTVGYTTPREFTQIIETIRAKVRGIERARISVHCHNDLGLAVANTIAALEAGARQVECTINGIGERAGNASLEEIVMALRVRHDVMPFATGIATQRVVSREPVADRIDRRCGSAQQGNRRAQRIRTRSRHSSGRRDQEPAHLRNHDAAVGWRTRQQACARQTFGEARAGTEVRTVGI